MKFLILVFFLSCSGFQNNPYIKQEQNSVDEIRKELKAEIKADQKAGKDVSAKKRTLEKLDNYSVNLKQTQKNEKAFAKEKSLADEFRVYRKQFIILVCALSVIGIGFLFWKYSDAIIPLIKRFTGFPF